MVKPVQEQQKSPSNGRKQDKQGKSPLKGMVNPPDMIQCCVEIRLQTVDSKTIESTNEIRHHLAVVTRNDEACVLILEDQPNNMPPIIHKILPVYDEFQYSIAQTTKDKNSQPDILVTLSVKGKNREPSSVAVIFPEENEMVDVLEELRTLIELARKNKYNVESGTHKWTTAYRKYGLGKKLSRATTMPAKQDSALSYVLPAQRTDSVKFVKLRRAGTRAASKVVNSNNTPAITAKQHWVHARLMDREDDFVNWDNIKLFTGTWNVHGSLPTESLKTWIVDQSKTENGEPFDPDFYVIALQEMETNKDAYLRYDPTKENAWLKAIFDALGPKANEYYKVATQQLVTILIIVIAKKQHEHFISDVEANYVGVGLMNMMGNKGGAGVRLRFHDSYLCFMGCHLAAFTEQVDRRNQDFGEICKRLTFPHRADALTSYVTYSWNNGGDEGVSFLENEGVLRDWASTASVFHSDYLIWLGDLNYRINLTEPEIKSHLRQNELDFLVDYDQLTVERRAGRAFTMFEEGAIQFMPTYKYDAGTNQYDSSAKRRAPSWTDRILWKKERARITEADTNKHEAALKLVKYQNCMEMMLSDHKPVYALMEAKIRKIDSKKQAETRSALVRQLAETQDNITKGQISSSFVEFGDVDFMEYKERTLILENTGQVLAPFRFIPKMDENEVCPTWLRVHPISGILGPGEKVVIHFEILIDPTISSPFNECKEEIDNILVLRLENGKDFFIVITGQYQPTCFGVLLERLALMSLPVSEVAVTLDKKKSLRKSIRSSKSSGATASTSSSSTTSGTGTSATATAATSATSTGTDARIQQQATLPKELWRVLNFLWNKNMLCLDYLFLDHGDRVISEYIRRCLDTGEQFDTNVLLSGKQKQSGSDGGSSHENDESSSDENSKDTKENKKEIEFKDEDETVGANSMIDILVAFLECLPEPVIPATMYKQALGAIGSTEAMIQFKNDLPHIHLNVLLYITSFLKDAIKYAPESYRDARITRIADIFTVMLRPAPEYKEQNPPLARQKRAKFILSLLNEDTNLV